MKSMAYDKEQLIKAITENRAAHRDLFERALEGYRQQAIERLERTIGDLRSGKKQSLMISMPMPQDHTADYDRVIRSLEMTIDPVITLEERDFAMYVMDQWDWKDQFIGSTAQYLDS